MFNTTVIFYKEDGTPYCHQLIEMIDGVVLSAAGHWTYNVGTEKYHEDWLLNLESTLNIGGIGATFKVFCDGGKRYKDKLKSFGSK